MSGPDSVHCALIGRYEGIDPLDGACLLRLNMKVVAKFPAFWDGPFQLLSTSPTLRVLQAEIEAVGDDPASTINDLVSKGLLVRVAASQETLVFKRDLVYLFLSKLHPSLEFVGTNDDGKPLVRTVDHEPWSINLTTLEVLTGMGRRPLGKGLQKSIKKLGISDEEGYQQFAEDLPILLRRGAAFLGSAPTYLLPL